MSFEIGLVFGPGLYRFTDFTKAGAPLNLLFWILGTLFIPMFWAFYGDRRTIRRILHGP